MKIKQTHFPLTSIEKYTFSHCVWKCMHSLAILRYRAIFSYPWQKNKKMSTQLSFSKNAHLFVSNNIPDTNYLKSILWCKLDYMLVTQNEGVMKQEAFNVARCINTPACKAQCCTHIRLPVSGDCISLFKSIASTFASWYPITILHLAEQPNQSRELIRWGDVWVKGNAWSTWPGPVSAQVGDEPTASGEIHPLSSLQCLRKKKKWLEQPPKQLVLQEAPRFIFNMTCCLKACPLHLEISILIVWKCFELCDRVIPGR